MNASRVDLDGDGKTDVLVFRPSDGYVAKWYSDTPRGPLFTYEMAQYIGGSPGAFPGAQLLRRRQSCTELMFAASTRTPSLVFTPSRVTLTNDTGGTGEFCRGY